MSRCPFGVRLLVAFIAGDLKSMSFQDVLVFDLASSAYVSELSVRVSIYSRLGSVRPPVLGVDSSEVYLHLTVTDATDEKLEIRRIVIWRHHVLIFFGVDAVLKSVF